MLYHWSHTARLKDTLSLNRVRSMLETINEPLGASSKDSDSNLQVIKKSREIVMAGVADVSSYVDKLTYKKKHHVAVALDDPQTRCTSLCARQFAIRTAVPRRRQWM